jgi:hypothetical protein
MDPLSSFGISFVAAFQSMGSWLVAPMEFFSFLGSENFFLVVMPLIYWSVDVALGIRIGFMLLVGNGLAALFKLPFQDPRPYWISTNVRGLVSETSFGIPSGHAETAAGLWGIIAAYYRRAWLWVAALLLVFAIGWNQIGLAFVVSLAMVLLGALLVFLTQDFVLPAEWVANATRDGNAAPAPFTASMQGIITSAATLFGMWVGLAWMARRGGFNASGPLWRRAARYVLGLVGVLTVYAGLKAVFPSGDTLVPYIFRYVRYTLLGFWVFGAAPWAFARLRLAQTH